jgi:Family of unknown function (DUF6328)
MTSGQIEKPSNTPLHAKIEQLLTEARVVLPGAQALFGFQLAIVLTQSFERLPSMSKAVHAASLFLVALAIVMLMAPAAYHRIVYAGEDTQDMYRIGSALVTVATVPLALPGQEGIRRRKRRPRPRHPARLANHHQEPSLCRLPPARTGINAHDPRPLLG